MRLGGEALDGHLILLAKALQKCDGQQRDVAQPVAERRQVDGHDVQAIIEVFAKLAFAHHFGQIAVGGRNQPDIDVALGGIAHLLDAFGLQCAEQLSLGFHAQVADFVEKQRALVGRLEKPLFCGDGAAERALHVAEQLAFQQGGGQGAAIAGHQRMILAAAEAMNCPDEHFLARAALADQQHRAIGGRHASGQAENAFHGPALANDPLEALVDFQFLPQGDVFADQARMFPCLLDRPFSTGPGEKGLPM